MDGAHTNAKVLGRVAWQAKDIPCCGSTKCRDKVFENSKKFWILKGRIHFVPLNDCWKKRKNYLKNALGVKRGDIIVTEIWALNK